MPQKKVKNKAFITLDGVSKVYGNYTVFEPISVEIARGEIVALIGPNGSGKSTLARIMLGLEKPTMGSVRIDGKAPKQQKDLLGYIPQRFQIDRNLPITVLEFLNLVKCKTCHTGQEFSVEEILKKVDMYEKRNQRLGTLSGGQLQRVLIARALVHQRAIVVLDEPSTGLDVQGEKEIYALLQKINKDLKVTIIVISHEMNFVLQYATQVLCINKKLLCAGVPAQVLSSTHMKELFGEHMGTFAHHHHDNKE